ncbi:hypothetical protein AAC387_Pa10g0927 [Persea americana]
MYSAGFFFFLLLLLLAAFNCNAEPETQDCQASCGTLANISYPFGLEHSSKTGCPKSRYNLKCKSNRAIFYFNERPYYVMNISYEEGSMWLIDSVLQRDNCSSLLSYGSSFSQGDNSGEEFYLPYYADRVVGSCSSNWHQCFFKTLGGYLIGFWEFVFSLMFYSCMGINWLPFGGCIEMRTTIGILCFSIFLVYKLRKKHIWMDTTVEEFLSNYSFGMLLMEIAGKRKNIDAFANRSSQIYFPLWIYNQLHQGRDMEMMCATDEEKDIAKKLSIVALWCIQMKPTDRPSMGRVVEMLEGNLEDLQMPSKPFLSPHDQDDEPSAETAESSTTNRQSSTTNSQSAVITNNMEESNIIEVVID